MSAATSTHTSTTTTPRHSGWLLFAAIMLLLAGILNVIWGIAAIDQSAFFVNDTKFILSNLNTWGWLTLALGIVQILASYSAWNGGKFGQWVGIGLGLLGAVFALLTIPAYPFWALAIFSIELLVVYGLASYGGQGKAGVTA